MKEPEIGHFVNDNSKVFYQNRNNDDLGKDSVLSKCKIIIHTIVIKVDALFRFNDPNHILSVIPGIALKIKKRMMRTMSKYTVAVLMKLIMTMKIGVRCMIVMIMMVFWMIMMMLMVKGTDICTS